MGTFFHPHRTLTDKTGRAFVSILSLSHAPVHQRGVGPRPRPQARVSVGGHVADDVDLREVDQVK